MRMRLYGFDGCCSIREKVKRIILYDNLRPVQFLLAVVAFFWGTSLLLPGPSLDRALYVYLRAIATEEAWAAAWLLLAGVLAWRTFETSASPWLRLLADIFSLLMFSLVVGAVLAAVFVYGGPFPSSLGASFTWALGSLWVLARFQFSERDGCE